MPHNPLICQSSSTSPSPVNQQVPHPHLSINKYQYIGATSCCRDNSTCQNKYFMDIDRIIFVMDANKFLFLLKNVNKYFIISCECKIIVSCSTHCCSVLPQPFPALSYPTISCSILPDHFLLCFTPTIFCSILPNHFLLYFTRPFPALFYPTIFCSILSNHFLLQFIRLFPALFYPTVSCSIQPI